MRIAAPRPRRRLVSLTPMIDVVFLILVFFMLASKFTTERALPISAAGTALSQWEGAPRLIEITPQRISYNGQPVALDQLAQTLTARGVQPEQAVLVRPGDGADIQRLTDLLDTLRAAGFRNAVLVP